METRQLIHWRRPSSLGLLTTHACHYLDITQSDPIDVGGRNHNTQKHDETHHHLHNFRDGSSRVYPGDDQSSRQTLKNRHLEAISRRLKFRDFFEKNKKKFRGVVEITALLLTDFTLTNFLSVIFGSNNAVISTTPSNFFSKTKKIPKSQLWRMLTTSVDFWDFLQQTFKKKSV